MPLDNAIAGYYTGFIPEHIKRYLTDDRGISHAMILRYRIGWNGSRIMIPIFDRQGRLVFFKQARAPGDPSDTPKMLCWPAGHSAELYGWENLTQITPPFLVICEGEFDRMVLESRGIAAVTGTAGAGVFLDSWVDALRERTHLFVCYDRDDAGRSAALRIGRSLPHARIVELPEDIGPGGDVSDFLIRLGRPLQEFRDLLRLAKPLPRVIDQRVTVAQPVPAQHSSSAVAANPRIARVKATVPLTEIVRRYSASLRPSGRNLVGRCPFHPDHQPSLVLYVGSQRYYCFGCGRRGDVIQFIRDAEHLSFGDALRTLEEEAGRQK